jgi:hypothetical protein
MGALNNEFENLMLLQQTDRGHRYTNGLTYKKWENIVLEDCSPWLEVDIGNGIKQKQMGFTAGCVRDLFLSGPSTIIYLLNNHLGVEEKAVKIAIHVAYNPLYKIGSFSRAPLYSFPPSLFTSKSNPMPSLSMDAHSLFQKPMKA